MTADTQPGSGSESNPNNDYEDVVERYRSSYGDSPRDEKANDKLIGRPNKPAPKAHTGGYRVPHNINYDGGNHGSTDNSGLKQGANAPARPASKPSTQRGS